MLNLSGPDVFEQIAIAKAKKRKWTPERVDLLKKLWADGLSCSQIAAELQHITRNAVIGKVNRLGLSGRVVTARAPSRNQPVRPRRTTLLRIVEPVCAPLPFDPTERTATACDILGLTSTNCHWPVGNVGETDFFFCGAPALAHKPYCAGHHVRAHNTAPRTMNFADEHRRRLAAHTRKNLGTARTLGAFA